MREPLHPWAFSLGAAVVSQIIDKAWPNAPKALYWAVIAMALSGIIWDFWGMLLTWYRDSYFAGDLLAVSEPASAKTSTPTEVPAGQSVLPYDVDARTTLLWAANRTWDQRSQTQAAGPDFPAELGRVYAALDEFYGLASAGSLRIWGRTDNTRPHEPIEPKHWQDWHIEPSTLFADPKGASPIRTVPRDRLPHDSAPYYDLRLNKAEVERCWPPHEFIPIRDAARQCFDETGLLADWPMSGEARLKNIICHLAIEARENHRALSLWGVKPPSSGKLQRIPPTEIDWSCMSSSGGAAIEVPDHHGTRLEWDKISVQQTEMLKFIERLKAGETAGQQIPTTEQ